jgi:Trypsin-like peptidase domain
VGDGVQQLTGNQISQLSRALTRTVNLNDLKEFVHIATGDQLELYWVNVANPLQTILQDLLRRLDEEGQTTPFLKTVYVKRPYRSDIRELIASMAPEAVVDSLTTPYDFVLQNSSQRGTIPTPDQLAPGLQRNVKPHLKQLDLQLWSAGLIDAGRRVCRVDIEGRPAGTGFLVGPQAVLTNWHVVEKAVQQQKLAAVTCRFDYARQADGSFSPGEEIALAQDGLVHHRPYAPAEVSGTPDWPLPLATELDFALLRLGAAAGEQRGCFALPDHDDALPEKSPLIIVQHPHGGPIKVAIDTEAVLPTPDAPGRPRLRYATNTDAGSSGAPCLSMDWQLLALHHLGDPAWTEPRFNQGIPAGLIRADIIANGHADLLCREA